MIRLIILVIGVFLIWVLFFSNFSKQRKIVIAAIAIVISIFGVWLESTVGKPKSSIVNTADVVSCGVSAVHSYRSNFDLSLCLQNNSANGRVKRIALSIIAAKCTTQDDCREVQRQQRELPIDLAPSAKVTLQQNLSFGLLDPAAVDIVWSTETTMVKAIRQ